MQYLILKPSGTMNMSQEGSVVAAFLVPLRTSLKVTIYCVHKRGFVDSQMKTTVYVAFI